MHPNAINRESASQVAAMPPPPTKQLVEIAENIERFATGALANADLLEDLIGRISGEVRPKEPGEAAMPPESGVLERIARWLARLSAANVAVHGAAISLNRLA